MILKGHGCKNYALDANMQSVQEIENSIPTGLRERKRARTRSLILSEAMHLFFERGFEATTLDDIAAAAEVSRRSLFHYFASKEEIVLSAKADLADVIAAAIARRPAEEDLLDMVENALIELAQDYQSGAPRRLARLIHETPSLKASDQAKYELLERVIAKALADRKGLAEGDLNCRVTAATAIGILKLATEEWLAGSSDESPESYGRAAFAALRRLVG